MSFSGTKAEARAIFTDIEHDSSLGSAGTSPILHGASGPGGAASKAKPAGEVQQVGRLRAGINKPRTRTDTLTRKYAASGSNK
jgi:hypothetical protein